MFSFKRLFILLFALGFSASAVFAQQTVEHSYLRESIELMIIRETARSQSREQKLIALEYIGEIVGRDGDNTNPEVRQTLDFLSREGLSSVTRENNRVINNYPDIRRRAARYLGQIKTPESKDVLIEIARSEVEPSVLQEVFRSLGEIGINNNNETIDMIVWVMNSFNRTNPDNLMALAAIDAFEKIADANNGIVSRGAVQLLDTIINGSYVTPVKERARQFQSKLRSYGR